jgi:hypothetical protein
MRRSLLRGRWWRGVEFFGCLTGDLFLGSVFFLRISRVSRKSTHVRVLFRPPSMADESLSLACPRESNQREHTLAAAVAGHRARRLKRGHSGGSLTAHPCADSERARVARAPLWAFSSGPRRSREGTRKCRARPSWPQKPKQQPTKRNAPRRRPGEGREETLQHSSSRRKPGPSAFALLPLLTRVPLWHGEGGRIRPAHRAGRRDTEGAFLLVTSLWASKEK